MVFRWVSFRFNFRMFFRDVFETRVFRLLLIEVGEDEVRSGERGLRGGEWEVVEGR